MWESLGLIFLGGFLAGIGTEKVLMRRKEKKALATQVGYMKRRIKKNEGN